MFDFTGKGALLIGAGQNIGREIAREFARRGARVAIADINGESALETAAMVENEGGRAIGLDCDITKPGSVSEAVVGAETFLGQIDILLNNAGVLQSGKPEDIPPEEWERTFDVNLFGAVRANALVMPKMIERGDGYIVNTASFAGLYPYAANRLPYAASKAALISMSENLALYLEPLGVRVSCLCPGPTMTTITDSMKVYSDDVPMCGPGSDLTVFSQAKVARILADNMQQGKILIPTHEPGWDTIAARGQDPDGFVRKKSADLAAGNPGIPTVVEVDEEE